MNCGCWQYFWAGVIMALFPSFFALFVMVRTTQARNDDDDGPTRGT